MYRTLPHRAPPGTSGGGFARAFPKSLEMRIGICGVGCRYRNRWHSMHDDVSKLVSEGVTQAIYRRSRMRSRNGPRRLCEADFDCGNAEFIAGGQDKPEESPGAMAGVRVRSRCAVKSAGDAGEFVVGQMIYQLVFANGVLLAGGVVAMGLGQIVELAAQTHDDPRVQLVQLSARNMRRASFRADPIHDECERLVAFLYWENSGVLRTLPNGCFSRCVARSASARWCPSSRWHINAYLVENT